MPLTSYRVLHFPGWLFISFTSSLANGSTGKRLGGGRGGVRVFVLVFVSSKAAAEPPWWLQLLCKGLVRTLGLGKLPPGLPLHRHCGCGFWLLPPGYLLSCLVFESQHLLPKVFIPFIKSILCSMLEVISVFLIIL